MCYACLLLESLTLYLRPLSQGLSIIPLFAKLIQAVFCGSELHICTWSTLLATIHIYICFHSFFPSISTVQSHIEGMCSSERLQYIGQGPMTFGLPYCHVDFGIILINKLQNIDYSPKCHLWPSTNLFCSFFHFLVEFVLLHGFDLLTFLSTTTSTVNLVIIKLRSFFYEHQ